MTDLTLVPSTSPSQSLPTTNEMCLDRYCEAAINYLEARLAHAGETIARLESQLDLFYRAGRLG